MARLQDDNIRAASGSNDSNQDDRRYFPRWEVSNRVVYQLENEDVLRECRTKDINCAGACIYPKGKIKPDTKIDLTIYLAENKAPVRALGKCSWSRNVGDVHLAGIQFDEISEKAKDLLFEFAFEWKREELVAHWFRGI